MKKKTLKLIMTIGIMGIMLTGCGGADLYDEPADASEDYAYTSGGYEIYDAEEADYLADENSDTAEETQEIEEGASESKSSDRKLIRTVDLTVETYDFSGLTSQIKSRTEALGGYVQSSDVSGNEESGDRYAYFTLRVPKDKADELLETIQGRSNVTSQSENVEDVTLTYVDIQSRKESLQVEYDRLEELLKEAEDVEDLIYIEDRMSEVRYEIETIESQLRAYDNQVDYTTIDVIVYEVKEYTEPETEDPTYGQRLVKALVTTYSNIWEGMKSFSIFILVAIPYIIVIGLPIALIVWLVLFIIKKSQKKAARKAAAVKKENKPLSVPYTERVGEQNAVRQNAGEQNADKQNADEQNAGEK